MALSRSGKIVLSFIVGSSVGCAIALLYATKAGKYLRSDISRKAIDMIEDGKKISNDTWNGVQQRAEKTIVSAGDFINSGLEKFSRKTGKVKDTLSSGPKS